MTVQPINKRIGKGVYVRGNDIDTDRIIPARFLKCVTFDELGPALFYDERFDRDNKSKNHVLDSAQHKGAAILISDANFGCGSSREHAPQSLQKFGIKAVIAGSFAEIFRDNCTMLGIPCVVMQNAPREKLVRLLETEPEAELSINLQDMKVSCGNSIFDISMKRSARGALLSASYDPLDRLLLARDATRNIAKRLGYV